MFLRSLFARLQLARTFDRLQRASRQSPRHRRALQSCHPAEVLEARSLLTGVLPFATAANVSQLVADINAANKAGGANSITLAANTTFDLTAVNNTTNGANGLPVIGATRAVNLTIIGNGETIDRSTAAGTPAFRLFDVSKAGSLSLQSVTLRNGLAQGSGVAAEGGAVYNQGTLVLSGMTVDGNTAQGITVQDANGANSFKGGRPGTDAAGGGIWSNSSLTVENSLISNNRAVGGDAGIKSAGAAPGGNAYGGGIDIAGGTANITGTTFGFYFDTGTGTVIGGGNMALGGSGANDSGGSAYGGAVYVAGGTVTLSADATAPIGYAAGTENVVSGGFGDGIGQHGIGYGGFLYVASGTVTLTNDLVINNQAGDYEDIEGLVNGYGGGIFIAPGAPVYIDNYTVVSAYTISNYDSSSGYTGLTANIDGAYIPLT